MQGKYRILAFLVQYTVFNFLILKVQLKFHVDPEKYSPCNKTVSDLQDRDLLAVSMKRLAMIVVIW